MRVNARVRAGARRSARVSVRTAGAISGVIVDSAVAIARLKCGPGGLAADETALTVTGIVVLRWACAEHCLSLRFILTEIIILVKVSVSFSPMTQTGDGMAGPQG